MMRRGGFSLVELLVVVAILALLAAILFPLFVKSRHASKVSVRSNFRQIGLSWSSYWIDNDDRFPDRRDLKNSLPGGYRPWTGWPSSDPRAGWALVVLNPYFKSSDIWSLPPGHLLRGEPRVVQETPFGNTMVWMWRFDRADEPVPLDNFWGKTPDQCVADLVEADNPIVGKPQGVSDVELMTEVYFPRTIASVPPELKGRASGTGGRIQLMLDGRVRYLPDRRLD